jgi:proteasome lid subunit RPN8/RPN11
MVKAAINSILRLAKRKPAPAYREVATPAPTQVIMTESCLQAMRSCMAPEIARGHEGVAYLLGLTNGVSTVIVGAIRPESYTTIGSFNVSSVAMARVVRAASNAGLQVVGQIHTHPRSAYHSGGDDDGARIAYDGYISIVVPNYGRELPSLRGAAIYVYRNHAFSPLGAKALKITNGAF